MIPCKPQDGSAASSEIISLLKKPLLFDTSDYTEQMQAAIAEVRQAEADLDASNHDSLASQLEACSVDLVYRSAQLEVKRQAVLKDVNELQKQSADLDSQIQNKVVEIANTDLEKKNKELDLAKLQNQKANIRLKMAARSRSHIRDEVKQLRDLLETPTPVVDPANGAPILNPDYGTPYPAAKGTIGALACRVEASLKKKLADALVDARHDLQTQEELASRRRKLERQRQLISGVAKFAGAVVGFVFGGPAGAVLGVEIGGAVGDLVNGLVEKQPPEQILLGLVQDGFTIAKAAGVDIEGKLNQVVALAAEDAAPYFNELEASLKPTLDALPHILDDQTLQIAFQVLDINKDDAQKLAALAKKTVDDLRTDTGNLGQLGTILLASGIDKPIAVGDPQQFLKNVAGKLFQNTQGDLDQLSHLGRAIGQNVEEFQSGTPDQREAKQRDTCLKLAEVLLSRVGQQAEGFRANALQQWVSQQQSAGKVWSDPNVQAAGEQLLDQLFPEPKLHANLESNLESALADKDIHRGEIQAYLAPWQKALDDLTSKLTQAGEDAIKGRSLNDPVAAAQARVDYIIASNKQFNENLIPFLKGDTDNVRGDLLTKLKNLENDELDQEDKFTIAEIDLSAAGVSISSAQSAKQGKSKRSKRPKTF